MHVKHLPGLLFLAIMTTCIEIDISVPSFPDIANYMLVDVGSIQQTISYNFLGYFIGALLYGPLSEAYGRRAVMIFGHALMFVGALGCFLANDIHFLLVSRFIQGLGASTPVVLVFAIIAEAYEMQYALKLYGLINAGLATMMALAPIAGGVINRLVGWRGNYGSVAVLSALTLGLILLYLPETIKQRNKLSMKSVMRGYINLTSNNQFMAASFVPSILFAAYMSYVAVSSFLYTNTFKLNISGFVLNQAIIITIFAVVSYYANSFLVVMGYRRTLSLSLSLLLISAISLVTVGYLGYESAILMTLVMSLFSFGFALCYPVIFQKSMEYFPHLRGTASSFIMGMRAILVTVMSGLTSVYYDGSVLSIALPIALCVLMSGVLLSRMISAESMSVSSTEAG